MSVYFIIFHFLIGKKICQPACGSACSSTPAISSNTKSISYFESHSEWLHNIREKEQMSWTQSSVFQNIGENRYWDQKYYWVLIWKFPIFEYFVLFIKTLQTQRLQQQKSEHNPLLYTCNISVYLKAYFIRAFGFFKKKKIYIYIKYYQHVLIWLFVLSDSI